jgi:YD repeat-containing protein
MNELEIDTKTLQEMGVAIPQVSGGATSTYSYPAVSNRLNSIQTGANTQPITHDANGATTDDGTRQYVYDLRGRLKTSTAQGIVVNYEVNALGLRVRKQAPDTDTVYHYDIQGHLIGESAVGATLFTREYIYLGDQPVAVLQ